MVQIIIVFGLIFLGFVEIDLCLDVAVMNSWYFF